MIFKYFLICLIFVRLSFLSFNFLGRGSLSFEDVTPDLGSPLLYRIETQQAGVIASLNLRGIDREVVLENVKFVAT